MKILLHGQVPVWCLLLLCTVAGKDMDTSSRETDHLSFGAKLLYEHRNDWFPKPPSLFGSDASHHKNVLVERYLKNKRPETTHEVDFSDDLLHTKSKQAIGMVLNDKRSSWGVNEYEKSRLEGLDGAQVFRERIIEGHEQALDRAKTQIFNKLNTWQDLAIDHLRDLKHTGKFHEDKVREKWQSLALQHQMKRAQRKVE